MKAFLFLGNPRWPVTHRIYCFPSIRIRVCETSPGHVSNSAVTLHGDQTKCFSSPGQGDMCGQSQRPGLEEAPELKARAPALGCLGFPITNNHIVRITFQPRQCHRGQLSFVKNVAS